MDINNKNIKTYTFKLGINDPLDYIICQYPELYQHNLNECKNYCIEINHRKLMFNNKKGDIHNVVIYTLCDINNNKPDKINLSTNDINCALYLKNHIPSNKSSSFKISQSFEENNIYVKHIYNNSSISDSTLRNNILNHELIHILIDNFCKLHYIENIKVTLHEIPGLPSIFNPIPGSLKFLETITFIIDETKEPNNRKIKFYEHFSDFYRTKNNDVNNNVNYKIIQEPYGDGCCLIEEIDPTQNIMQNIEIKKSQENIIADKDTEIYKLKKEIEELKKFYINS